MLLMELPHEIILEIVSYLPLSISLQLSAAIKKHLIQFAKDCDYYEDYKSLYVRFNNCACFHKTHCAPNKSHYLPHVSKYRFVDEFLRCVKNAHTYQSFTRHCMGGDCLTIINHSCEMLEAPKEFFLDANITILELCGNMILPGEVTQLVNLIMVGTYQIYKLVSDVFDLNPSQHYEIVAPTLTLDIQTLDSALSKSRQSLHLAVYILCERDLFHIFYTMKARLRSLRGLYLFSFGDRETFVIFHDFVYVMDKIWKQQTLDDFVKSVDKFAYVKIADIKN